MYKGVVLYISSRSNADAVHITYHPPPKKKKKKKKKTVQDYLQNPKTRTISKDF
jgi:hypothetical protein